MAGGCTPDIISRVVTAKRAEAAFKQEIRAVSSLQRLLMLAKFYHERTGRYPVSIQELAAAFPDQINLGSDSLARGISPGYTISILNAGSPEKFLAAAIPKKSLIVSVRSAFFTGDDNWFRFVKPPCKEMPSRQTYAALEPVPDVYFKPSDIFNKRGVGHFNQREYKEALKAYEQALIFNPFNPAVYINRANIYEVQGDKKHALENMEIGCALNPKNPNGHYGLGRYHFLTRRYDKAIQCYSNTIELCPDVAMYNHAIARAYQEHGDRQNAIKYFQKYLQYAPHGEFVPLVKGWLSSVGASVADDPSDTGSLLEKRCFKDIDERLMLMLKENKKDRNGYGLLNKECNYLVSGANVEKLITDWVSRFPESHFANLCAGSFYIDHAWRARGEGVISAVTSTGLRLFHERLEIAAQYLEKAFSLDPSDPLPPAYLIHVATGLGWNRSAMEKQFRRSVAADKTEYEAYHAKLNYLKPEWHGSEQDLLSFGRECFREAPTNSAVGRILAVAYWAMDNIDDNFKKPFAWSEIKASYEKVLTQFPDSDVAHNWLARSAQIAGDYATAAREFEVIKDDWLKDCWHKKEYFQQAKNEVFARKKDPKIAP